MYATASNHASASYADIGYNGTSANYITNIDPPTMSIPENLVFLVAAAPFVPMVVLWLKKRKHDLAFIMNRIEK